jgi:S-adenosylmethionine decarboxylase
MVRAKGVHALLDFTRPREELRDDATLGHDIVQFIITTCKEVGIKVLASNLEVFDGVTSPPGFASVIMLDESHASCHCYSDEGLLAADLFTCGSRERGIKVASMVKDYILARSSYRLVSEEIRDRFIQA